MRWAMLASIGLLSLIGCSKPSEETRSSNLQERCAPGVTPLPDRIQRGVCVAHNYQAAGIKGYGSKTSAATLRELKELGVQWVSLTPFGFMRTLHEPEVHPIGSYPGGETDERLRKVIGQAKELGLRVLLKPHIWIVGGQWRGDIDLPDKKAWNLWFDSYEAWMSNYANLAETEGVDILAIGVELRSTERALEERWRELVRKVRRQFHGKLTYSANWDDAATQPWWDSVDYIGVQFYPPLTTEPREEPAHLRSELAKRLDELQTLAEARNKPVLFTEVGYRAAPDAFVQPHAWPERSSEVRIDHRAQALGYDIFVDAVRDRPWVAGIYWWKWFTDPNTAEEGPAGFSPRYKPAEAVLRAAYGGSCAASARAVTPKR